MSTKKCSLVFVLLLGCLSFTGCYHNSPVPEPKAPEQEKTSPQNSKPEPKKVKNVILVIGDGMGLSNWASC